MSDVKKVTDKTEFSQSTDIARSSISRQSSNGSATSVSAQTATGEQQQTQRQFANVGFQMSFRVKIRGGQPTTSSC
jgi:hypothetical protein